ncbi:hypothetical protein [Caenimonas sp. SL110]|uniref:hypothetical protein n=1 Tax=Caenimonas sp. SL110 TaxID=1450524 RepID=UPI0006532D17|nr:hypothetical protein [Caenimonas sp. SL110]
MISSSTTAGRRASQAGHARLAAAMRVETPLPRRHGEPPQRGLHFVHGKAGEHVQLEFSELEQKSFSFPPAMGFGPCGSYVDDMGYIQRRGSFMPERLLHGTRQFVQILQTQDDAVLVRQTMEQAAVPGFHSKNRHAPNCVGAAGEVISAVLKTAPLAPTGQYVSGPELADRIRAVLGSRGIDTAAEPPRAQEPAGLGGSAYGGSIYD